MRVNPFFPVFPLNPQPPVEDYAEKAATFGKWAKDVGGSGTSFGKRAKDVGESGTSFGKKAKDVGGTGTSFGKKAKDGGEKEKLDGRVAEKRQIIANFAANQMITTWPRATS